MSQRFKVQSKDDDVFQTVGVCVFSFSLHLPWPGFIYLKSACACVCVWELFLFCFVCFPNVILVSYKSEIDFQQPPTSDVVLLKLPFYCLFFKVMSNSSVGVGFLFCSHTKKLHLFYQAVFMVACLDASCLRLLPVTHITKFI